MRIGILGTMVWDRIHSRDGRAAPVEEWGGISYALGAAVAATGASAELVPILKIGRDLEHRARDFLRDLPRLDLETGIRVVAEPNNRVELRYLDRERRCERLTGGVPGWSWQELEPIVQGLDALYLNFISGFEMELETAQRLRLGYPGPIYCDLHSIFLGVGPDGMRVPRPLEAWRDWLRCFDIVQVNEDELGYLAAAWGGDPWLLAAEVVGESPRLLFVTLGERGSAYVASQRFTPDLLEWRRDRTALERPLIATPGAARTGRIAPLDGPRTGDPTGCGDVWGATCFMRLLEGFSIEDAVRDANRAAARNVEHLGASGLHHFLQGRIGT